MNRVIIGAAVVALLGVAVAFSRQPTTATEGRDGPSAIQIASGEKNPWTNLKLNNGAEQFQFAVISDRTGGHRANVFAKAVHQINLLQPEFVVSVGDLIEGYTLKPEVMKKEWDEFDSFAKKLEMPFFYVPGNHDLTNKAMIEYWGGRYGKTYYHFVYKNTLFLAVNSEDGKGAHISPEQNESMRKVLEENKNVRWTTIFVHKPLWTAKDLDANGWAGFEKSLEGRKYTVFCGHVHRYQKFVRNGMNHYQLATTGGGSKLRGLTYGEFDHLAWITMKQDGPLIANVMLDGILPENLKLPETGELGSPTYELIDKIPLHPTTVTLTKNGQPVAGATVTLHGKLIATAKERNVADGLTDSEGRVVLSTVKSGDGVPAGEYRVSVFQSKNGGYHDGEVGEKSQLPEKYASHETSGLVARVVAGRNSIEIELK